METVATFCIAGATLLVGWLAWRIGCKQNEINKKLLELSDYVTVYVAPLTIRPGENVPPVWDRLFIQNASSRPVALVSFTISGDVTNLSGIIPQGGQFGIPVAEQDRTREKLTVIVVVKDIHDRLYSATSTAIRNMKEGWTVTTAPNIRLDLKVKQR